MLTLVTAPTVEPVTVAEARSQLKLGSTAGEPAPTAPTAALVSPAAAGNVDNGAHRYAITFVTADGETERGTVSAAVTVADKAVNGRIALTAIPTGGAGVTARRIYRTAAGGSTYLLLATLADNTTTTYTDNVADASLGAQAPSVNTTVDPELVRKIAAARRHIERLTNRALVTQTWALTLDGFPAASWFELPRPPLQSVSSITYTDLTATTQTLPASDYVVSAPAGPTAERGRVSLAYNASWPSTYGEADVVTVTFVAGYGATAAAVPEDLREALLLVLTDLYEHRASAHTNRDAVATLVGPYRSLRW